MKKIKHIFFVMAAIILAACGTDADTIAKIHDEAGAVINYNLDPSSAILGTPESGVPIEDAKVNITTANLDVSFDISEGTYGSMDNIEKIEFVKSFNGGDEISIGETSVLPYNLVVDNLDDLLAGTGLVEDDLRIGDVLSFRTKVHQNDGDVYYYNNSMGSFSLVINCGSDLAGEYQYTDGSGVDVTVTETAAGVYSISADNYFSSQYALYIRDVCGEISIIGGVLSDDYGIAVSGSGSVSGSTITLKYTVDGYITDRTMTLVKK